MKLSAWRSWGVFIAVAMISLLWSGINHRFEPLIETDSSSYTAFDWSKPRSILSNQRTFGYPMFFSAVTAVSSDPRAIPIMHWVALIVASFIMNEGLIASGYQRCTAIWASGTLIFGRAFLDLGRSVTADSLACSLAIAAAGCFLASNAVKPSRSSWWGLMLFTFASYQTRPAYLFLIPLWPILGFFLDRFILHRQSPWKSSWRRCGTYAAVTVIPFAAFCTLRWGVVGHWGLVSFGGYNIIGVVGQYLDRQTIDAMPADLKPVAQAMFDRSTQLKDAEPPLNFAAMERMYNPTIWEVAVPTVKELHGDNPLIVNRVLSQLSGELLRRHFRKYIQWLVWNGVHAVKQVVHLTITDTGTRMLAIILLVAHVLSLWRGPAIARGSDGDGIGLGSAQQTHSTLTFTFLEFHLLFWTALAFAAAKGLLVILVEPANDRYMSGAMPLLPAAIAVFVAKYFESRSISHVKTGSSTH